jgi:hypothetical protein
MRKQLLLLIGLFGLLLLAGYLLLWLTAPPDRINRQAFEQIENGMTELEVEWILGVPPGDHTRGLVFIDSGEPNDPITLDEVRRALIPLEYAYASRKTWYSDQGIIDIVFDESKRVGYKQFFEACGPDQFMAKLRRWLGITP